MKHKVILGLILSSFVSANSFAMEINGGKLVSHKEWTTGNVIQSSFKDIKDVEPLPVRNDNSSYIFTQNDASIPFEKKFTTNQDVTMMGKGLVMIFNTDSIQKTYTITTTLMAQPPCKNPDDVCPLAGTTQQNIVTLDPHGIMKIVLVPTLTTKFSFPGTAKYWVQSDITTNDSSTHFISVGDKRSARVTDSVK